MPASAAHKHKKSNKFHFKSFSNRLTEISVDAVHRIKYVQPSPETEDSSKFYDCLLKWKDLDRSAQFVTFCAQVLQKCQTYKLVVYYKEELFNVLEQQLRVRDTLALQGLLELLVALCGDLGPDFYPKFEVFFPVLTSLLNGQNADKLEWTFVCLSMLFRNLWRYMITDMDNVLNLYSSLLTGMHPAHIGAFAAESISFLFRKIRNQSSVLQKLFGILQDYPDANKSLGQVLFQMLKTSQHQFHSCTERVLPVVFSFLKDQHIDLPPYDSIFYTIDHAVHLMADHTRRQYAVPVWKVLLQELSMNHSNMIYCNSLLKLLNTWCQLRGGSRIVSESELMDFLIAFSSVIEASTSSDVSLNLCSSYCKLLSTIVTCRKSGIGHASKESLITTVTKKDISFECLVELWNSIVVASDFQEVYMKPFMHFCQMNMQQAENRIPVIKLLVKCSLVNTNLPENAAELSAFKPRLFQFSKITQKPKYGKPGDIFHDILENANDWSHIWYSLVALFSVRPLTSKLKGCIISLATRLVSAIDQDNESLSVLCMACQLLFTIDKEQKFAFFDSVQWISLISKWNSSKHAFFILDMILSRNPTAFSDLEKSDCQKISTILEKTLSSPNAGLRQLTLRLLQVLDPDNKDVYQACLMAENTPATVHDIRAKILHLSKLQYHANSVPLPEFTKKVVVRFLFSNLFINFKSLWQPVQDLLCTYAIPDKEDSFWYILLDQLKNCNLFILNNRTSSSGFQENEDCDLFVTVVHETVRKKMYAVNERVNFLNYRLLLWKTLYILPEPAVIQFYATVLAEIQLQFLKNEFFAVDKQLALTQDIEIGDQGTKGGTRITKSAAISLLMMMFDVFARFPNIESTANSDVLYRLYNEFLSHPEMSLQRSALLCIFKFGNKTLSKYQDDLLSFLDDKKFRDAVTHFVLDDLSEEDRVVVIPVLLRILLGRMKSTAKLSTGGKAMPLTRKSVIIRFLNSLTTSEIENFIEMIIEPFVKYLGVSELTRGNFSLSCLDALDQNKVLPIGRQQGILKTIQLLVSENNQLLSVNVYATIFNLLVGLNATNSAIIESKTCDDEHNTSKSMLGALRAVKKQTTECLLSVLKLWPTGTYLMKSDCDMLFTVQIWPELPKLVHESSGKPGLTLKMLRMFAERLEYMPLLAKAGKTPFSECETSPLETLVDLLNCSKTSSDVAMYIIDLFLEMLYENPESSYKEADLYSVSKTLHEALPTAGKLHNVVVSTADTASRFQFGMTLLTPYLGKILLYFVSKMQSSKKGVLFSSKQLEFLSAVSQVVRDHAVVSNLSELLLGHVIVACSGHQPKVLKPLTLALKTLSDVIKESRFVTKISRLFSKIHDREARIMLVCVLQKACSNDPQFLWTCDLVARLNAWNKRFVEEFDFDVRLTAFQDLINHLKAEEFPALFEGDCTRFLPIMHTCTHTMLTCFEDVSLRESTTRVFELLIQRIQELLENDFDFGLMMYQKLVKELLLPALQTGLQSPNEGCRNECVKVLSKVVAVFPNESTLLGLDKLRNEDDPEDDIFENLRHIQMHRRGRAFRKLANLILHPHLKVKQSHSVDKQETENAMDTVDSNDNSKLQNVISAATASKYLLPLAMQTLHTQNFKNISYLRDDSIELVKSCASIMEWPAYRKLLLKNIFNIDRHALSFQIICAILEVFPFDLSSYIAEELDASSSDKKFPTKKGEHDNKSETAEMSSSNFDKCESRQNSSLVSNAGTSYIFTDVTNNILPRLNEILSSKSVLNENKEKQNLSEFQECKKKLPLAIPIVAVLKKLPDSVMTSQLPGVMLKVFAYMRHKLHDIRIIAEETAVKMLKLLGPPYLHLMLKNLKVSLNRGFQRHVLVHVVNALMTAIVPAAEVGIFDTSLPILHEILNDGLFGDIATEKKVEKLKQKIPEARGRSKAYVAYRSLATFISIENTTALIEPLKVILDETHSHSTKKIIHDLLGEISVGLLANNSFKAKEILTFVYGLVTENVAVLFSEQNPINKNDSARPQSCLLIEKAPKRLGAQPTFKSSKTNLHVLIEFVLQILHISLKRQVINVHKQDHLEMLDPLVPSLTKCLKSTHLQTVVLSIRCLTKLFKTVDLPGLVQNSEVIIASLFKILRDQTKGARNQEIAAVSFKSLSFLCFSDYGKKMTNSQLHVLLTYAEADLYDDQRQSTSFSLIKSIIRRGLESDDVLKVADKVRNIAIQSQNNTARNLARSIYLYFLVNYPLHSKKISQHIEFMLAQLTFEYEDGRMSALELLSSVVSDFPDAIISTHAAMLFIPTAAVMVNDESAICRKGAAGVIKILLKRLDNSMVDELFSFVLQWYTQDEMMLQQRLGAMLLCIFVEVLEAGFSRHLSKVFPLLLEKVEHSSRCPESDVSLQASDHIMLHHMSAFLSILRHCNILRSMKIQNDILPLLDTAESLLDHPHDWIQLVCSQIFGCVFATWDPLEVTPSSLSPVKWYATADLEEKLLALCKSFCQQLKSDALKDKLAEQAIKNLLFLAKVLDNSHFRSLSLEEDEFKRVHKGILYMLRQMRATVVKEQSFQQKEVTKRLAVLKFCAAFCLNVENPQRVLPLLLDPVYRCSKASASSGQGRREIPEIVKVKSLSEEVLEVIKSKVDCDAYIQSYTSISHSIVEQQRLRKETKTQQLVTDPVKAAAHKIRKHEKTALRRKRKIAVKRPEYGLKLAKRKKLTKF